MKNEFLTKNAMYIVSTPWFFLSALELWMAAHHGDDTKYIAAFAFGCVGALFYIGQKSRYDEFGASEKNEL